MSVYYNFSQFNDTDKKVLLSQTDTAKAPILDNASSYELSVIKFNLPSGELETFLIENDDDYKIMYSCVTNIAGNTAYETVTFEQPMYKSSAFQMRSVQDWLENYNRTSLLCFKGLLNALNPYYSNRVTKTVVNTSSNLGNVAYFDINLDFSTGLTGTNLFASYINVSASIYGTTTFQNMEFQLIDNNGKACILSSCKKYADKMITYEDGSINNQNSVDTLTASNYQPMEPLVKLCQSATTQKGVWKLRIFNKNSTTIPAFNVSYSVTATIYFAPYTVVNQMHFPRVSPSLTNDIDTLSILYDDNTPRSSFKVNVSPKLYNVLSFPGSVSDTNPLYYALNLPQTSIANTGTMTLAKYPQVLPSAYKLIDVSEIQLRSNNLPVSAEQSVFDQQAIITSINTDSEDLNNSIYQYVNTQPSERTYAMNRGTPVCDIHLSVFIRYRSSNIVKPMYLSPYSTFNCLLKFIKVNSIDYKESQARTERQEPVRYAPNRFNRADY